MLFSLLEKRRKRRKERRNKGDEISEEVNEEEVSPVTGIVQPADTPIPPIKHICSKHQFD